MKTRTLLTIGISALVVTGPMLGAALPGMMATAASTENPKLAAAQADKARGALAKRQADKAVRFAEAAVAYAPQDAGYRALLGQAYLLAGRFTSARQALTDTLSLDSATPGAALNLALAQIAEGDWQGARGTLEAHSEISVSDRGLAFALAGDPVRAVQLLGPAARDAESTPKLRQNLALSLALAGHWEEARAIAALDVAPDQIDARIEQWAAFSRPANAYDQVASLLGVRPVADSGQPVQLALVRPAENVGVAAVVPTPQPTEEPVAEPSVQVAAAEPVTTVEPSPEPQPEPAQVAGTGPQVVFGPRQEIVQPVQVAASRAAPAAIAVRVAKAPVAAASFAKGSYYVQLGAYVSPAVARDAWRRTASRVPEVGRHQPQGARVTTKAGNFYRLSVGGFARNDADSLCRQVKSSGGACFVRVAAGDAMASWVKGGTQVASR
ncbi:SPOR domain-containing protein [Sphingomonas sp.]|uniref:SPOR domain-containing protein n=1 Tax=Sphingomonas sp. TaxID=28214 RepID=UPI001B09C4A5|nr:SPOR domain-containing protein [Sphingomonas sp.]MBO9712585.1 SPOR domain-containing protein [Sphingomonas sp.]